MPRFSIYLIIKTYNLFKSGYYHNTQSLNIRLLNVELKNQ